MLKNEYVRRVYETVEKRNAGEVDFPQAVYQVLESLEPLVEQHPEYEAAGLLERFVEPERVIIFSVPWTDDEGKVHVNRGFRVQFNSAIGPYKGGLRFHPTVDVSDLKALAFEQTLKNSLTTLPMGGGKGGSDFDPHGRSDAEVMRFCQSFMNELYRHIGPHTDIPAGDIGVGAREVGYLYGQYKRITGRFDSAVITGKGIPFGGSLTRTEATGYGLCYFVREYLRCVRNDSFEGKRVIVSGSGNVALHAAEKATQLGGTVIAMSDSAGYVYDPAGINIPLLKDIKLKRRARITVYADEVPTAEYHAGARDIWGLQADICLPCSIQNEINADDAKKIISNGTIGVFEGANLPCTPEARALILEAGLLYSPGKASNAGGVAVSGLEMSQNSLRLSWTAEEVDERLQTIMAGIFHSAWDAAEAVGAKGNLMTGANAAAFMKVAAAMLAQGAV